MINALYLLLLLLICLLEYVGNPDEMKLTLPLINIANENQEETADAV